MWGGPAFHARPATMGGGPSLEHRSSFPSLLGLCSPLPAAPTPPPSCCPSAPCGDSGACWTASGCLLPLGPPPEESSDTRTLRSGISRVCLSRAPLCLRGALVCWVDGAPDPLRRPVVTTSPRKSSLSSTTHAQMCSSGSKQPWAGCGPGCVPAWPLPLLHTGQAGERLAGGPVLGAAPWTQGPLMGRALPSPSRAAAQALEEQPAFSPSPGERFFQVSLLFSRYGS